ncbi:MAG: protein BatD [Deltaproteobacteria bacterium]|nr:protein BatD [Deltaproteobacteria bacterium]
MVIIRLSRIFLLVFVTMGIPCTALAQYKISLSAEPARVRQGEEFKLIVKMSAVKTRRGRIKRNFYNSFNPPSLKQFEMIDQSESTQSQIGINNGRYYQELSHVITYYLRAKTEGRFTVSPAVMTVSGRKYKSNKIVVSVNPPRSFPKPIKEGDTPLATSTGDDFFQITVNKTKAYLGEGIMVSWYIYTYKPISEAPRSDIPDAPGFISKSLFSPHHQYDISKRENVHGESYYRVLAFRRMYWPQKSGKLVIGTRNVSYVTQSDFLSPRRTSVRNSAPVTINVLPLPASGRPANFSDDNIGNFKIDIDLTSTSLKTGEAIDVTVKITGDGLLTSLKGPQLPDIDWARLEPNGNPVISEKLVKEKKFAGSWKASYILVPVKTGKHLFPKIIFNYFDPSKGKYIKATTKAYSFDIAKGKNPATAVTKINPVSTGIKENFLAPGIKPIKIKPVSGNSSRALISSFSFFITSLLIPFGIWGITGIIILTRKKLSSNKVFIKKRAASRRHRMSLKLARQYMHEGKSSEFYSELTKLLMDSISEKTGTRAMGLTTVELSDKLKDSGCTEELITQIQEMLESLDFARYAPDAALANMQYETALGDVRKLCDRIGD